MGLSVTLATSVYENNITHNLSIMAQEAGIYPCLWEPNENGFYRAEDIILPLTQGLKKLKENPEHFKQFDSPNGWGTYQYFVPFVENYLFACIENPNALIIVDK